MALLDLYKAFDMVPRHILQDMIDKALPLQLAAQTRPLLYPMSVRTIGQKSKSSLRTIAGVPQGDPPSALVFLIFMNSFLLRLNIPPSIDGTASAFVDDAILFARTAHALQNLLDAAHNWSAAHKMKWAIPKCLLICDDNHGLHLNSNPLSTASEAPYLGVAINHTGVTDKSLLDRIRKAHITLSIIIDATKSLRHSARQRRLIIKTFVFSIMDYILYLQPITPAVLKAATALESRACSFILGYNAPTGNHTKAITLCRILPLKARRRIHLLNAIAKFQAAASLPSAQPRDTRNWSNLRSVGTVAALLRKSPVTAPISSWLQLNKTCTMEGVWQNPRSAARQIPLKPLHALPPILRNQITRQTQLQSIRWYFNRLPMTTTHRKQQDPELRRILQADHISTEDEEKLEKIMATF